MSLSCPRCENRLSRWEVAKFIRLMSIYCAECNAPLSLDKPGRTALWLPIILSFFLLVICMKACEYEFIALILLIAGFVAGAFSGDKYGTLSTPSEEEPDS